MTTIFISIPWFLPAFRAGGPVQSIANLVNECNAGISYKIFCGNTDLNNMPLENITTGTWVRYNDHTEVWYAPAQDRRSILLRLVKETKPGILFIIGIYSWPFTIVPLLFSKVPHKIISARGMLHPGALSQKSAKKKLYISVLKNTGLVKKATFHATDEVEKKNIIAVLGKQVKVSIAGNFPHKILLPSHLYKETNKIALLTVALISPMKNHLLVLDALKLCKAEIAYHICGPVKDAEYWKACKELEKTLPQNISVFYHGDIQPGRLSFYLGKAHAFILPSKSENFGHALYEALSAGLPVITSHFTPWQNLEEARAGMNVENEQHSVSKAIERFAAMEEKEFADWRNAASAYAESTIDLTKIRRQYADMFSL